MIAAAANLSDFVLEKLRDNIVGLDTNKVIMCAIHTHTGPGYPRVGRSKGTRGSKSLLEQFLSEGKKYVERQNISNNPDIIKGEEALYFLGEKITKVTLDAWAQRRDGSFTNAFGRASVGMCRRANYSDGSAQMWGETNQAVFTEVEGGSDTGIELLFVYDQNNKLKVMKLPLRRATLSQINTAKREIHNYLSQKEGDVDFNDAAKLQVHTGILAREALQNIQNVVDTEVHTIKLGSVAIATNPFELFLNYGNQIKARSHAEQTFLIQLANGIEGYFPTEKAEKGGHYSAFVSSRLVGHEGGYQLVRETLEHINNELFPL